MSISSVWKYRCNNIYDKELLPLEMYGITYCRFTYSLAESDNSYLLGFRKHGAALALIIFIE